MAHGPGSAPGSRAASCAGSRAGSVANSRNGSERNTPRVRDDYDVNSGDEDLDGFIYEDDSTSEDEREDYVNAFGRRRKHNTDRDYSEYEGANMRALTAGGKKRLQSAVARKAAKAASRTSTDEDLSEPSDEEDRKIKELLRQKRAARRTSDTAGSSGSPSASSSAHPAPPSMPPRRPSSASMRGRSLGMQLGGVTPSGPSGRDGVGLKQPAASGTSYSSQYWQSRQGAGTGPGDEPELSRFEQLQLMAKRRQEQQEAAGSNGGGGRVRWDGPGNAGTGPGPGSRSVQQQPQPQQRPQQQQQQQQRQARFQGGSDEDEAPRPVRLQPSQQPPQQQQPPQEAPRRHSRFEDIPEDDEGPRQARFERQAPSPEPPQQPRPAPGPRLSSAGKRLVMAPEQAAVPYRRVPRPPEESPPPKRGVSSGELPMGRSPAPEPSPHWQSEPLRPAPAKKSTADYADFDVDEMLSTLSPVTAGISSAPAAMGGGHQPSRSIRPSRSEFTSARAAEGGPFNDVDLAQRLLSLPSNSARPSQNGAPAAAQAVPARAMRKNGDGTQAWSNSGVESGSPTSFLPRSSNSGIPLVPSMSPSSSVQASPLRPSRISGCGDSGGYAPSPWQGSNLPSDGSLPSLRPNSGFGARASEGGNGSILNSTDLSRRGSNGPMVGAAAAPQARTRFGAAQHKQFQQEAMRESAPTGLAGRDYDSDTAVSRGTAPPRASWNGAVAMLQQQQGYRVSGAGNVGSPGMGAGVSQVPRTRFGQSNVVGA